MKHSIVLLAALWLGACTPEAGAPEADQPGADPVAGVAMSEVSGTLIYRERMMLTPEAVATVWLLDVSRADVPATEIARQTIESPGAPPIPFLLTYQTDAIDERMSYAVRAEIRDRDQLMFTTDRSYPVLTRGAPMTHELLLVRTAGGRTEGVGLSGTRWRLEALEGTTYDHQQGEQPVYLEFAAQEGAVGGFAGCNGFTGSYQVDDDRLSFGPLAVTQRACESGMDVEAGFLKALSEADRFALAGDALRLFAGDREVLSFTPGRG